MTSCSLFMIQLWLVHAQLFYDLFWQYNSGLWFYSHHVVWNAITFARSFIAVEAGFR